MRETARSWPVPPHLGQVSIGVPGSAPLPWQCSQRVDGLEGDLDRGAVRGLGEVDLGPDGDVAALRGTAGTAAATAEDAPEGTAAAATPKKASKMSATEPKPSKLGA